MVLVLGVAIALQSPKVQSMLTNKAEAYLSKKTGTRVNIGAIQLGFPKSLTIKDVYVEDKQHDTLLYSHELGINMNMWGLLRKEIRVNAISLEKATAHIERTGPDSSFNYSFIVNSFIDTTAEEVKPQEDTTGKSGWDISLYDLDLKDIYVTYRDRLTGVDAVTRLGSFSTHLDNFDLQKNKFNIDYVRLQNTYASLIQKKRIPPSKEETKPMDYDIGLNTIALSNVQVNYADWPGKQAMNVNVGQTDVKVDKIDLVNYRIALEEVSLENSGFGMFMNKPITADTVIAEADSAVSKEPDEAAQPGWNISLAKLSMANDSFRMENYDEPEEKGAVDFAHLAVGNIQADVKDIQYNDAGIRAMIDSFAMQEKSGFRIEKLQTKLTYDSTHVELAELYLRTGNSIIQPYLAASYPSLATLADDIGSMMVNAKLNGTAISLRDILYFQPDLANQIPFKGNTAMVVRLNTDIQGRVDDLDINALTLSTEQSTFLRARGHIKGLPDVDRAYFDISLPQFATSRQDVKSLLPGLIPDSINLPQSMRLNGMFKGTLADFHAKADATTSLGDLAANVTMKPEANGGKAAYTGRVEVQSFELGQLLGQKDMGALTMWTDVKGSGLSMEDIKADVYAQVETFEYKQYAYNNIVVDGQFVQQAFTGVAMMKDENLDFDYKGTVSFNDTFPRYDFKLDLRGADLQALNFTEDDIRVSGRIGADITGTDLNNINGNINIGNVLIVKNGEDYHVNSLLVASINKKRNTSIDVKSDFFTGYFRGTIHLGDLPKVLQQHMDHYFAMNVEKVPEEHLEAENFEFELQLHKPEILTDVLLPDLQRFVPGAIRGNYSSEKKSLNIDAKIPQLTYAGIMVDTLDFNVNSDARRLNYTLSLQKVGISDILIRNMSVSGKAEQDSVSVNLAVKDGDNKEEFLLAGLLQSEEKNYKFMLLPTGAIFNYEAWTVAENSYIKFGKNGVYANNFRISKGERYLAVDSRGSEVSNAPLFVDFGNFDLTAITGIAESNGAIPVSGILTGNVELRNITTNMAFVADAKIESFSFKGDTLGTVDVLANNTTPGRYAAKVDVSGNGNKVKADGYYSTLADSKGLNFDVDIERLDLSTVEAYTAGQLTDLTGFLYGDLKLTGSTDAPNINGGLRFSSTSFRLTYLGSQFSLLNEKVTFDNSGIHFPGLTIRDSAGRTAKINGSIYTKYFTEFRLALNVTTDNFHVLNTTEKDNQIYYGKLVLTSNINIKGDINEPVVTARLNVEKGTELNVAVEDREPATVNAEGIVEFIDVDNNVSKILTREKPEEADTGFVQMKGIDATASIAVDKDAVLKLIVDPDAGDYLEVRGKGTLSFGINPSGSMSLTGRYEISEGSYQLTFYNFIKRRFDIQPGSSITWLGDPLDADLDITATYEVKASPLNLVSNQISGASETDRNRFKQKIPFDVNLSMTGKLMEPTLDMGITLPEDERGAMNGVVYTRLQQLEQDESEMNKQVFALLTLNQFLAEDPLATTEGDNGLNNAIANSVSELLSQQLNAFAENYLQGVNLSFDIENYDDYSSGQAEGRTQLKLNASKQFLNDRLTVQIGSDVDLQGEQRQQQQLGQIVGDVNIEYKLTKDGRLRMTIFRNNEYAGVIEGQVIETGTGLIFVQDYNKFKQLFKKSDELEPEDELP